MIVGTLSLVIGIPEAFSLKDKRRVVKSLKDRIAQRFNVSVAEVGDLELYNRAELGAAMVGNDAGYVEGGLQQVVNFVQNDRRCVLDEFSIDLG